MAEPIGGPFAVALRDGRHRYNALFAQARRSAPSLTPDSLSSFLRQYAAPVVDAAAQAAPDRLRLLADAVFDQSLELLSRDLPTRWPIVVEGWTNVLAGLPRHMAADPLFFGGSITNALYNMSQVPGSRPAEWIRILLSLGKQEAHVQRLLNAGRVAAWRCGMAQYRRLALDQCRSLDDQTVKIALDLPAEDAQPVTDIVARLDADPWSGLGSSSGRSLHIVRRVGDFRGFGGPFIRPPYVSAQDGHLLAGDGEQWWTVYADCFGTALVRGGAGILPQPDHPSSPFHVDASGTVQTGNLRARFDQLHDILSVAETDKTLAVSVAYSHRIFLIAATGSSERSSTC